MPRSLASRCVALLLGLLVLLSGAETAFGAGVCPHHAAPASSEAADADASHAGHHAPAPEHGDGHDAPCTCAGACQAGGGAVFAAEPASGPATLWTSSALRPAREQDPALPCRPPYLLPYSTAPPARG